MMLKVAEIEIRNGLLQLLQISESVSDCCCSTESSIITYCYLCCYTCYSSYRQDSYDMYERYTGLEQKKPVNRKEEYSHA